MSIVDESQNKLDILCKKLKEEALGPAQKEAQHVISQAQAQAEKIILEAKNKARELVENAQKQISSDKTLAQIALDNAVKQAVDKLKSDIEHTLFNPAIHELLDKPMNDPVILARLIQGFIQALEKDGLAVNLSLFVPKTVSADDMNVLVGKHILSKLNEGVCLRGEHVSGVKIRLNDKKMTLEFSSNELVEVLSQFLRADLRIRFFG